MTAVLAEDLAGLDLSGLPEHVLGQLTRRLLAPDFRDWASVAARVGYCSNPIRLRGSSTTINTATGELLASYKSEHEPDGLLRVRCGNRRASACPSCSRVYAADTWHLIAAGAAGGKGVPETVGEHPMVFATLTAPSFGPVHVAPQPASSGNTGKGLCRPRRAKDRVVCEHCRAQWCTTRHEPGDAAVGQPLCPDCYDYAGHVVWQWHAPELWRRFTIALRRAVARRLGLPDSKLGEKATVQYAKVAEFQRRGAVHFHALVRLDGPRSATGFMAPPAGIDADDLAELVRQAARSVEVAADRVDAADAARILRFGDQLDARPVVNASDTREGLSASQVAGYIAKYATKSATDADFGEQASTHFRRIRGTVRELADRAGVDALPGNPFVEDSPYVLLGKWVHMLGFRGHFSSKSRQYSTTLGALRGARRTWRTAAAHARRRAATVGVTVDDLVDEANDETTLVIGDWEFIGMGWRDEGEVALANAAAARSREHQRERAARVRT